MFSVFLTITTLGWIQSGVCVDGLRLCSTCFPNELTKNTLGSLRLDDTNKVTWQGRRLKIGATNQKRTNCTNCALTIYLGKPCRAKRPSSGNCEISTTVSVLHVQFRCHLREDGHATPKTKTFTTEIRANFQDERTRLFRSGKFRNGFYHVRILDLKYVMRGCRVRIMPEQIIKGIKPLVFVCKQCNLRSRHSSSKEDGVYFSGAAGRVFFTRKKILAKKSLRKRRHVLGNTSSSYTYSAYFSSPHAVNVSPVRLPVTLTLPSPQQPSIYCPQSAVINGTTIILATPAAGEQFSGTLVSTGKLTPFLKAVDMLQSRPSTSIAHSVQATSSFGGVQIGARGTPFASDVAQMRTTTANATFIYNSRLVTVVYTASNSSYAFITTWNCATVTPNESESRGATPTDTPNPSETNPPRKKMNLVVGLAIGGGIVLGFLLIAVLTVLIRRYRRVRGVRKKAKQISYFNRYDCSAAWDEPFGGSRLSVFTLKNSKFDIDWETPNEGKRQEAKEEEFGGRSL